MHNKMDYHSRKILVTGSRGKSSIVRYLHAALSANGIDTYARITGVIPRELSPHGMQPILRGSGAHVEEMRWWLKRLPPTPGAIVMENSAISPDLQPLPAIWLKPDIFVLTNVRPDHNDAWGPTEIEAARVLVNGILQDSNVVIPEELTNKLFVTSMLRDKNCTITVSSADKRKTTNSYVENNLSLALKVCELLDLDLHKCRNAICSLQPDIADFHIFRFSKSSLASAFSANDPESTEILFDSTGWKKQETLVLFFHRKDRPLRLKAFKKWITSTDWKNRIIIGDKPFLPIKNMNYVNLNSPLEFKKLVEQYKLVFGCGNVIGLPLEFLGFLKQESLK